MDSQKTSSTDDENGLVALLLNNVQKPVDESIRIGVKDARRILGWYEQCEEYEQLEAMAVAAGWPTLSAYFEEVLTRLHSAGVERCAACQSGALVRDMVAGLSNRDTPSHSEAPMRIDDKQIVADIETLRGVARRLSRSNVASRNNDGLALTPIAERVAETRSHLLAEAKLNGEIVQMYKDELAACHKERDEAEAWAAEHGAELADLRMWRVGAEAQLAAYAVRDDRPPAQLIDGMARRSRTDLLTPAERAIAGVVDIVERIGAHVWLTDAVILLGKAKDKVADYVESCGSQTTPRAAMAMPSKEWFERKIALEDGFDVTVGQACEMCGGKGCDHCNHSGDSVAEPKRERDVVEAMGKAARDRELVAKYEYMLANCGRANTLEVNASNLNEIVALARRSIREISERGCK